MMLARRLLRGSVPRVLEYVTSSTYVSSTAVSSVTFSGVSLGAADSDRIIVAGLYAGATGNRTISSLTVAGSSMNLFAKIDGLLTMAGFYYLAVPSGTTADFVATFSGNVSPAALVVYRLTDWPSLNLLDSSAAYETAAARSGTVDVAQRGAVLAVGANFTGGTTSTGSVTNLDSEDANLQLRTTTRFVAGHSKNLSSSGTLTPGITYSRTATVSSPLVIISLS